MTTTETITTAMHVAHLDAWTGLGVLVLPNPGTQGDVWLTTTGTQGEVLENLTESDWAAMMQRLHRIGWELLTDDDDLPLPIGVAPTTGREGLALILSDEGMACDVEGWATAEAELLTLAGLEPMAA